MNRWMQVSVFTVPSTHRDIPSTVWTRASTCFARSRWPFSVTQAEEMSRRAKDGIAAVHRVQVQVSRRSAKAKELIEAGSLGQILNFRLMFGGYIDMTGQWYSQKALSAAASSWTTARTRRT